jgi:hypothetical protein
MGLTIVRVLAAGLGVLMMLGGVVVASTPAGIVSALPAFLFGAALLVGVAIERLRYRSEAAERTGDAPGPGGGETSAPEPRFRPTEERFIDPTTSVAMRVYVDPATGERRYRAEA